MGGPGCQCEPYRHRMPEVRLPNLFAFEDPIITRWLVSVGDHVTAGDDMAAVELDKAEAMVTAPVRGRVTRIHHAVGDHVETGDLLAEID